MNNVISFERVNNNAKTMCTLASPNAWQESIRFCWVHGFHHITHDAQYALTCYTNINHIEATDALVIEKDLLTIRTIDGREWEFYCPAAAVSNVIFMLCEFPMWLSHAIKHGLDLDLIMRLDAQAPIIREAQEQERALNEKVDRMINSLFYAKDSVNGYIYRPKTHDFEMRTDITLDMQQKEHAAIISWYYIELFKIRDFRCAKIQQLKN